jgi:hypothetical protein
MRGLEATVRYDLRRLASEWVGPAKRVDVVVRFGDPVTELTAAQEVGAGLVVAGSQRRRWLVGWDRDQRLRRAVNGPRVLVGAERASRRIGEAPPRHGRESIAALTARSRVIRPPAPRWSPR